METTLAILMVLGIYVGIPAIVGFAIAGVYLFVARRVRQAKHAEATVEAQLEQPGEAVPEEMTKEAAAGTRAYFEVRLMEGFDEAGCVEAERELEAIPEVKYVEPVGGRGHLLVTVEAPIRVVLVAHKIMAKGWVERLRYATVEEAQVLRQGKVAALGLPKVVTREPEALQAVAG